MPWHSAREKGTRRSERGLALRGRGRDRGDSEPFTGATASCEVGARSLGPSPSHRRNRCSSRRPSRRSCACGRGRWAKTAGKGPIVRRVRRDSAMDSRLGRPGQGTDDLGALLQLDPAGLSFTRHARISEPEPEPELEPEPEPEPQPELPEPEPELELALSALAASIPEGVPGSKSTFEMERERLLVAKQPVRKYGKSRWASASSSKTGAADSANSADEAPTPAASPAVTPLEFRTMSHPTESHGRPPDRSSSARVGKVKLGKMRGDMMSRSADYHNPAIRRERQITFSATVVQEVECSSEELERKREWNAESKKSRAANKAQVREERRRARRQLQETLGKRFGVEAMPSLLVPSSDSSDSSGSDTERMHQRNADIIEGAESSADEQQEVELVAHDAVRRHSHSLGGRSSSTKALEIAKRNSPASEQQRSPRSILRPEPHSHNWQRCTIWAGGIPEELATEEMISLLFRAAFGSAVSVTVRLKPTEEFGTDRSWAFVTFAAAHAAARARLAGVLSIDHDAQQQLLPSSNAGGGTERHETVVLQLKEATVPKELQRPQTGALAVVWQQQEEKLARVSEEIVAVDKHEDGDGDESTGSQAE
jgi:hypothetical protein